MNTRTARRVTPHEAGVSAYQASNQNVGKNLSVVVSEKGIMTITIDLNANHGPSASGKTNVIATSSGNVQIAGANGATIGVNVYRKV